MCLKKLDYSNNLKCRVILLKKYHEHISDGERGVYFSRTQRVGTQYAKILLYRTQTSTFACKMCNFH